MNSASPYNIAIRRLREEHALKALHRYGHLRAHELRVLLCPELSERNALVKTMHVLRAMAGRHEIVKRLNSLGTTSYVLGSEGVNRLRQLGINARLGYDIAGVQGPTFWHRTLGTAYLVREEVAGAQVYGEYALSKGLDGLHRQDLYTKYKKVPDGLVLNAGASADTWIADWIEVESAAKVESELFKIFEIALLSGKWMLESHGIILGRLVFVMDSRSFHRKNIMRAARKFREAASNRAQVDVAFDGIYLVEASLKHPLTWESQTVQLLSQLMAANNPSIFTPGEMS